ncbi:MAG: TonB family protein [Roseivirga sp.]|nr:TonB family protein [Roseivirga sp.]
MKYKFVKKGTEISSENIGNLMDFGQVMDKAAGMGMGAAPLAKGALGAKTASLTKILWVLSVPFTVSVYFAVTELTSQPTEIETDAPVQTEAIQSPVQVVASDSAKLETMANDQNPAGEEETTPPAASDVAPATPPVDEPKEEEKEEEEPEEILVKEDIMIKAEPVGGFPAFYKLIDKELTYPETARISHIEGFVRVYFVVDKEGKAGNFRVVRSLGDEFDKEALRVMKKITDWVPATHNGQPVSSHMSIKLRFELEKETEN